MLYLIITALKRNKYLKPFVSCVGMGEKLSFFSSVLLPGLIIKSTCDRLTRKEQNLITYMCMRNTWELQEQS